MANLENLFPRSRIIIIGLSLFLGLVLLFFTTGTYLAAPSVFDWDFNTWPSGSLTETYSGIGSPATVFTYTFTGDTNRLTPISPVTNKTITGGTNPQETTLFFAADFVTVTESVTLTIELSREAMNVSFVVMDIDTSDPFTGTDKVTVSGFDSQGTPVIPNLTATDPSSVSIVGNTATGLVPVGNHTDNGNVTVVYGSPVDTLTIVFGEGSTTAPNIDHGIALYDISFDPFGPTSTPTNTPTITDTPTLTPETPTPTDTMTATPPTATPTSTLETPTPTSTGPALTETATMIPSPTAEFGSFVYLPVMIKE